jgi:hypothetical protein
MRISRLFKRLRRWSSQVFRKRHSPAVFRTCRNAGNSLLTAEGTTSKGTGSISCEVEFCIFYRLSLRTLRTNDVIWLSCSIFPSRFYETDVTVATETSNFVLKSDLHFMSVHNKLLRSIMVTSTNSSSFCMKIFRVVLTYSLVLLRKQTNIGTSTSLKAETHWSTRKRLRALPP